MHGKYKPSAPTGGSIPGCGVSSVFTFVFRSTEINSSSQLQKKNVICVFSTQYNL